MLNSRTLRTAAFSAVIISLAACSQFEAVYPDKQSGQSSSTSGDPSSSGGFFSNLFGGGAKMQPAPSVSVNGFLWRASLDTLSFLPLASTDPFGGVIITEWYAAPETPAERFKGTVNISD